jgi:glyoxylase-like metal-dependent hydrolase (beta-lactamase superfamily II)
LDHLCFWVADRRLLFSGDLVAGAGTIVLSDVPNALTLYLDSLARVLALGPSTLLPGHGPIVADGQAKVQEYVDHRLARERQIVSALVAAPATVEELVARIYIDTPAALHNAAARNVRAHLERLAVFGRATAVSGRWRLMGHPNPHDRS